MGIEYGPIQHKTSFILQFWYLFMRSIMYNLRNPRSLKGLLLIALLNGFMYGSIFESLGDARILPIDPLDPTSNRAHNT